MVWVLGMMAYTYNYSPLSQQRLLRNSFLGMDIIKIDLMIIFSFFLFPPWWSDILTGYSHLDWQALPINNYSPMVCTCKQISLIGFYYKFCLRYGYSTSGAKEREEFSHSCIHPIVDACIWYPTRIWTFSVISAYVMFLPQKLPNFTSLSFE